MIPPKHQVTTFHWLGLPTAMRNQIAEMFNVPKKGHSTVFGNKILSDGYRNEDLAYITSEKINAYLGTDYTEKDVVEAFFKLAETLENKDTQNGNTTSQQVKGGDTNGDEDERSASDSGKESERDTDSGDSEKEQESAGSGESASKPVSGSKRGNSSKGK